VPEASRADSEAARTRAARGAGSKMSGTSQRRDCCAASWRLRRQRSARLSAGRGQVLLRPPAQSPARWRPLPARWLFSIAHSNGRICRRPSTKVTGSAGSASSSAIQVESEPRRWRRRPPGHERPWPPHTSASMAGLRAQDAGHVLGLLADQGCGGFVPMLGNPAARVMDSSVLRVYQCRPFSKTISP